MNSKGTVIILFLLSVLVAACSSIDCPLKNKVYTTYRLMGDVTLLQDELTISTTRLSEEVDSILLNPITGIDSFSLPISYQHPQDVFYFHLTGSNGFDVIDTVTVEKLDHPHFESIDCKPCFFHTITGVSHTHNAIDSIVINNPNVTYEAARAHFFIYFKSR